MLYLRNDRPTNPFTILEPQDQEIGEFYVVQERHMTDFKAPKLWMGSSGVQPICQLCLIIDLSAFPHGKQS